MARMRPPNTPKDCRPASATANSRCRFLVSSRHRSFNRLPLSRPDPRLTLRVTARDSCMKAALLPERGVVKVAGEDARKFLNGLLTADIAKVSPQRPAYAALLTPQGKIMIDMIVAEAPAGDGGGFFLDCPRALCPNLVERLNFYKLRAKVIAEDLSEMLGVMAVWDGPGETEYGLCYADPRLRELGMRCMLPPHVATEAAADLGAALVEASEYEAHRITLG